MELNPNTKDEYSIKEIVLRAKGIWKFLVNRRKIVFIATIIGSVLGLVYSLVEKPVYTASLTFAMEDTDSGGMGGITIGSYAIDLGGDSGGGVFSSSSLPELFLSRNMVERTLLTPIIIDAQKISFAEMYIQNEGWREKWAKNTSLTSIQFLPNANRSDFSRAQDSILGIIYENLTKADLKVSKKEQKIAFITIDLESSNELFAKQFSEALADQVSSFFIDYKSRKARENLNILSKETDSIRRQLNIAITEVAVSVDNTFNLNPALNVQRTPTSRKKVDVEANSAILKELIKQTELAKVGLRKKTPLIQIIDRPILPLEKVKTSEIIGAILGGFLALFMTVLFLVLKILFKQILE
jgi:uncharacterized protein involved in exopolysaccharide biosynthesis